MTLYFLLGEIRALEQWAICFPAPLFSDDLKTELILSGFAAPFSFPFLEGMFSAMTKTEHDPSAPMSILTLVWQEEFDLLSPGTFKVNVSVDYPW